jgi:hypothetical protein
LRIKYRYQQDATLGGLRETIQWVADGLSGLVDKAMEFIGMKGEIEDVNAKASNPYGGGGGSWSENSQTNYITVSSPEEAAAYASESGPWVYGGKF